MNAVDQARVYLKAAQAKLEEAKRRIEVRPEAPVPVEPEAQEEQDRLL